MPGFDVAPAALAQAAGAAAAAKEQLQQDRNRLDARMRDLVTVSWRGSAADSFRECWDEWLGGAARVAEGLEAMGVLLAVTRHDYERQDADSEHRLSSVAGRIVERLG